MDRALYQCDKCGLQMTLYTNGASECHRCGGTMRPMHPLAVDYSVGKKPEYSNSAIKEYVDRGMKMIYERLAVERELDKIDSVWYNKRKEGQDGEETDDDNRVSL